MSFVFGAIFSKEMLVTSIVALVFEQNYLSSFEQMQQVQFRLQ